MVSRAVCTNSRGPQNKTKIDEPDGAGGRDRAQGAAGDLRRPWLQSKGGKE